MSHSYLSTPFHAPTGMFGSGPNPDFWASLSPGGSRTIISDGSPTLPPLDRPASPESATSPSTPTASPLRSPSQTPSPFRGGGGGGGSGGKKKSWKYGPRDSLNARYRIGRPGSRRYQRWHNEYHLVELLSDTESTSEVEDLGFDESAEPNPGVFAFVFEDDNMELIAPFLHIDEELEGRIFEDSDDDEDELPQQNRIKRKDKPRARNFKTAQSSFSSLKRKTQRVLRKHSDSDSLKEIDAVISSFLTGNSYVVPAQAYDVEAYIPSRATLEFSHCFFTFEEDESYLRLLVHSVAEFYDLASYSQPTNTGKRRTYVQRKEEKHIVISPPSFNLSSFLSSAFPVPPSSSDSFSQRMEVESVECAGRRGAFGDGDVYAIAMDSSPY